MSKELTQKEIQDRFLRHVRGIVEYWKTVDRPPGELCDGVAFSILTMLDGGSALPAFEVVPSPHPDDREFLISEGEDYYPDSPIGDDVTTVHGDDSLHELWHKVRP